LKGISASILLQSGLSHEFWPLAHRYIECAYPITKVSTADPEITCYEAHHGYAYEGVKAPFGCLVYIKSVDPLPFAPKGESALFLGGELIAGQKFKGLYHVMPLSSFRDGTYRERIVRTLAFPPGQWQFPVKGSGENVLKVDNQPGYLGNFPEELDDEDLDDEEIARRDALLEKEIKDFIIEAEKSSKGGGGESSSVHARVETKPKPAERNRKITKLRVASYGPTKGCDACMATTITRRNVDPDSILYLKVNPSKPPKRQL
jgi:hypothetical protein